MDKKEKGIFTDDIVERYRDGVNFNPPYRFVVGRYVTWDKKQNEILQITDSPAIAYLFYQEYQKNSKGNLQQVLYTYYVQDSFTKDALEYCKQAAKHFTVQDVAQYLRKG